MELEAKLAPLEKFKEKSFEQQMYKKRIMASILLSVKIKALNRTNVYNIFVFFKNTI